jgi:hypothetical protein
MTTYQLDLREADEVDGKRLAARVLASLTTEDPETMAATLRAVADRLAPPPRSVLRDAGIDPGTFATRAMAFEEAMSRRRGHGKSQ